MPLRAMGEGMRRTNGEQRHGRGVPPSTAKGLSEGARRRRQRSFPKHGSLFGRGTASSPSGPPSSILYSQREQPESTLPSLSLHRRNWGAKTRMLCLRSRDRTLQKPHSWASRGLSPAQAPALALEPPFFSPLPILFYNFESMITHLQET